MQTYEGGLGGAPGNEAHGGYTYCGLAALMLIDQADVLDLPSLLRWLVSRQASKPAVFRCFCLSQNPTRIGKELPMQCTLKPLHMGVGS